MYEHYTPSPCELPPLIRLSVSTGQNVLLALEQKEQNWEVTPWLYIAPRTFEHLITDGYHLDQRTPQGPLVRILPTRFQLPDQRQGALVFELYRPKQLDWQPDVIAVLHAYHPQEFAMQAYERAPQALNNTIRYDRKTQLIYPPFWSLDDITRYLDERKHQVTMQELISSLP